MKTGLSQQSKWAEIDQLLFGVMYDLDGLKAAYVEMCSRIDCKFLCERQPFEDTLSECENGLSVSDFLLE